ncbi:MAG: D-alanine--D-alanine ligase [Legionellaceae bacterium]|nr:D-alanine--D-alanine ligase [Legionellaceae bacterium]
MPQPSKVALIYGGKSGEHEVSLRSAASIFHHLDKDKYEVSAIAIDKDGQIFLHDATVLHAYPESLPVHHPKAKPLPALIEHNRFIIETDCVFPAIHGPLYEDGCLQGLLEMSNTPYVGCNVLASAIGMDKDIARRLACDTTIPSARYTLLNGQMSSAQRQDHIQALVERVGWPLFIKPCSLGSSVGIHKAQSLEEAQLAIEDALRYDASVLIEEYIQGREIEIAVLEDIHQPEQSLCSIPGEIRMRNAGDFYSYDAKYRQDSQCELLVPALLSDSAVMTLQQHARTIFRRLKCQGMARVDFFVQEDGNKIYFNEINTLPGFTSISMYPRLWEASGIAYAALLDKLLQLALKQQAWRQQRITSYL